MRFVETLACAVCLAIAAAIGAGWLAGLGLAAAPTALVAIFGWIADTLSQFQLVYAAGLGAALAVLALRRRWRAIVLCIPLVGSVGVQLWPYLLPIVPQAQAAAGREVRVAALNVWFLNGHPEAIIRWVVETDADLLVLSEVTREIRRALAPALARYPYQLGAIGGSRADVLMLSKVPLSALPVGARGDAQYIVHAQLCLDAAPGDPARRCLRVVGAHLPSPVSPAHVVERDRLLALIGGLMADAAGEARIVLGDLNTTPFAPGFRALLARGGLADSAQGRGLRPTWNARLPVAVVPIDHILVGGPVAVSARTVGPFVHSDHLPVTARLRL